MHAHYEDRRRLRDLQPAATTGADDPLLRAAGLCPAGTGDPRRRRSVRADRRPALAAGVGRQRFPTLGEKRNAAARLVSPDVEALAVWDDDDLYMPWALRASAAALEQAAWSRPSLVLHPQPDGSLRQHRTGGLFHSGWAYRRDAFERAGGYPRINNGEDQGLAERFRRLGVAEADPLALGFPPFLVYRWAGGMHLSWAGPRGYENWGRLAIQPATVEPSDPPVRLEESNILPGVNPRMF